MLSLLRITGYSLSPAFQDGDFVLLIKIPFFLKSLKSGDIVVFKNPVYGIMIKQIERIAPGGEEIYVVGTHPDSTDSRQFGPVRRKDLLGKVVWHIKKANRTP